MTPTTISALARGAAVLAAGAVLSLALAHDWAETDPSAALADAEIALTLTERFLDDAEALAVPEAPLDLTGWPAELAWWTRVVAHIDEAGTDGRQRRIEIIGEVATAWTQGEPADGTDHLRWRESMGVLVAHAAGRSLTDAQRADAEDVLGDPAATAADAELASWIALLPRTRDDELRDLAAVLSRLDALVERGLP